MSQSAATHRDASVVELLADRGPGNAQLGTDVWRWVRPWRTSRRQFGCRRSHPERALIACLHYLARIVLACKRNWACASGTTMRRMLQCHMLSMSLVLGLGALS
jgi:hypothetical protein